MHVCYICNEYPGLAKGGGIGSFIKSLSNYMVSKGNRVTILGVYKNKFRKKIIQHNNIKVIVLPYVHIPKFHWEFNRYRLMRLIEKEHRKNKFDLIEAPDYQGLLRKIKIARRKIKEGPIYFKGKTT